MIIHIEPARVMLIVFFMEQRVNTRRRKPGRVAGGNHLILDPGCRAGNPGFSGGETVRKCRSHQQVPERVSKVWHTLHDNQRLQGRTCRLHLITTADILFSFNFINVHSQYIVFQCICCRTVCEDSPVFHLNFHPHHNTSSQWTNQ